MHVQGEHSEKMTCRGTGVILSKPKTEACGLTDQFFWFESLLIVSSYPGIKIKSNFSFTFNELPLLKKD